MRSRPGLQALAATTGSQDEGYSCKRSLRGQAQRGRGTEDQQVSGVCAREGCPSWEPKAHTEVYTDRDATPHRGTSLQSNRPHARQELAHGKAGKRPKKTSTTRYGCWFNCTGLGYCKSDRHSVTSSTRQGHGVSRATSPVPQVVSSSGHGNVN